MGLLNIDTAWSNFKDSGSHCLSFLRWIFFLVCRYPRMIRVQFWDVRYSAISEICEKWSLFTHSVASGLREGAASDAISNTSAWKRATLQPLINEGNRESDTAHTVQYCTDSFNQSERKSLRNSHPSQPVLLSRSGYTVALVLFFLWMYKAINIHSLLSTVHVSHGHAVRVTHTWFIWKRNIAFLISQAKIYCPSLPLLLQ